MVVGPASNIVQLWCAISGNGLGPHQWRGSATKGNHARSCSAGFQRANHQPHCACGRYPLMALNRPTRKARIAAVLQGLFNHGEPARAGSVTQQGASPNWPQALAQFHGCACTHAQSPW